MRPRWITKQFTNILKFFFPGRKLFSRPSRLPILKQIYDYMLFDGDDVIYLPKNSVVQVNEPIDSVDNTVVPSDIVDHFIKVADYRWIMSFCICRSAEDCEDYPQSLGCIFLGESVLDISPDLGRLASKEEALEHAQKCRDAGLVHMIGRNKIDRVWMGVPEGKLLTICNCCPCCCLWKLLPALDKSMSSRITKMPGVELTVTEDCVGCGLCAKGICFVDAIQIQDGKAVIDQDQCRGCGRCVEICPQGAIEIEIQDENYFENAVRRIAPLADIGWTMPDDLDTLDKLQ
ncbi:MAG: 4Fe-4S binding protein [Anaerolineaceae bacterium]|nr:4Fe-4S binding protein [Anaerolineaceae bacterium]